jgi:Zn-dependent protease with chaperone function
MSSKLKLWGLLVILPLALLVWAGWQHTRISRKLANDAKQLARIELRIADLEELKKNPAAWHSYGDVQHFSKENDLRQALEAKSRLEGVQWLRQTQGWLPPAGAACSLAALATGLFGLWLGYSAGQRALRSREALLSAFSAARRLLPWIITGLTVFTALALVPLLVFETANMWNTSGRISGNQGKLMAIMVGGAIGLIILVVKALRALPGAFKLFQPDPLEIHGTNITPTDAPGLWTWVRELAHKLAAPVPDRILVGLDQGFFVTSGRVRLLPAAHETQGLTLYLPLPLMALLDREETAAIVGHELGHFAGEDTAYSLRFLPIYGGVQRSLETVVATAGPSDNLSLNPSWLYGCWFMERFDHAVQHWSRLREFAADATGEHVAGREPSCRALVRTAAAEAVIHEQLRALHANPDAAPTDLVQDLRARAAQAGFASPDEALEQRTSHPTDTHPTTRERLAALGEPVPLRPALATAALRPVDATTPPWFAALFANLPALNATLTREFSGAVAAQEATIDKNLAEVVQLGNETRELRERSTLNFLIFGFLALIVLGFAVGITAFTTTPNRFIGAAICGAVGLFFLWFSWHHWSLGRGSCMRLEPAQIVLFDRKISPLAIAWTDIDDLSFFTTNQKFTLTFFLNANPQIKLNFRFFARVSYKSAKRSLHTSVNGVRGLNHDQLAELIHNYWRAGQARSLQSERAAARHKTSFNSSP